MNKEKGILYLIPSPLGEGSIDPSISAFNLAIIKSLDEFIVEDLRTARRFLIKVGIGKPIDELTFHLLNEHTRQNFTNEYLESLLTGKNVGLLSDAGCPVIADPGASVIKAAHEKQIKVVPLVGPSSVLLALMASGLNGQSFTFHGYLPKQTPDRIKKIRQLETETLKDGSTQIFIETPYRNDSIIKDILSTCKNDTLLCIASDITMPSEYIRTLSVADWKKEKLSLNDHPAVFLIGTGR
jgi:16S rRNA (cytidine1402-2'-O)-methyltransferase